MSLRTQKISRLLEYVTTKHLVFGSTIYCMFESENTEKSVRVVPGTDNSDKWLINNYLQLYPSSSGPYTVQRKARSSQRLKETHKKQREEEAKSCRGYLNTSWLQHQHTNNKAKTAAQQGTPPRCYRYTSTSIWRASQAKRARKKQDLQEIQYGSNIEECTFQIEGKIGQVSVLQLMVRFLMWMASSKPESKITWSVTEEGRQKECGDKHRLE